MSEMGGKRLYWDGWGGPAVVLGGGAGGGFGMNVQLGGQHGPSRMLMSLFDSRPWTEMNLIRGFFSGW